MTKRTRNPQPTRPDSASRGGTGAEAVAGRTRLREPQRPRSPLERYRGLLLGIGVATIVVAADRAPEPQCQQAVPGYTPSPGPVASTSASPAASASPAPTAAP